MWKALYIILSFCCLGYSITAQQLTTDLGVISGYTSSSNTDEISPPKILPPVSIEGTEGVLLFSWEKAQAAPGSHLMYEFVLYGGRNVLYSVKTESTSLRYGFDLPRLKKGATYSIQINTVVSSGDASYILYGKENAINFTYIPECTVPKDIKVIERGNDFIELGWEGRESEAGDVEYIIQYNTTSSRGVGNTIRVTTGKSARLTGLTPTENYAITVQKVCFWYDGSEVLSEKAPFILGAITPEFMGGNCGDAYQFPPCTAPYASAGSWSTLSVGGFQIIVLLNRDTSIIVPGTELRETRWNGKGRLLLPFGARFVQVSWKAVPITTDGKICGLVKGISDIPANLPNLNPAPAVFGDEICKKTTCPGFDAQGIHCETGMPWDTHGFNDDGLYVMPPYDSVQTGVPYDSLLDPNGFNADGIHFDTGTEFGPDGCNQNGIDSLDQPCQPGNGIPYYWLQDSLDTNGAAYQLLEDVQDSLGLWIQQYLNTWSSTLGDSISQTITVCQGIRGVMDGLIISLGYNDDRELILGPDDLYFEPGMWKKFSETPKTLPVEIARDANTILLESKHIDLYHCDKKQDAFASFKGVVDSLIQANSGVADLADVIADLILKLSEEEAEEFANDHNKLRDWIKSQLKSYLSKTFCDGNCAVEPKQYKKVVPQPLQPEPENDRWGDITPPLAPESFIEGFSPEMKMTSHGSLASVHDFSLQQLIEALSQINAGEEALLNSFLQGDEYVDGVSRAFILEAIGEARRNPSRSKITLTDSNPELMPVAIANLASDGRTYRIWLDQLEFTPNGGIMDAYFVLDIPNSGKKIAFSALDVPITPNGMVINPARLRLANDVVVRMNNTVQLTLKANGTFVTFDCDGYAGINLDIDIEVCRDIVKPLNPATMAVLPDPERVRASVQVFLPTLDELYMEVDINPFVVTGIEDFKWLVSGIVVDFSDVKSPTFPPPSGYASPFANGNGFSPLWRGFYMRLLTVTMPNQFNANGTPITVGVQSLVIDNMGVSGRVFATPLLPLDQGNAGGWAFSVDEFSMTIIANQPVNAKFTGRIHVPLFSAGGGTGGGGGSERPDANDGVVDWENTPTSDFSSACNVGAPTAEDCFKYEAFIEPGVGNGNLVYRMSVNTGGQNWCANIWKAGQVVINSGSQIDMTIENGAFTVSAKLNGTVKITEGLSPNIDVGIPNITFQNLIIQNKAPYFTPGVWGFPIPSQTSASLGGFTLSLSSIKMLENGESPSLSFDAGIKITDNSVNLSATGGFQINGMLTNVNGRQRWVFKDFAIRKIDVNGSFPGVEKIVGILEFYEGDPTFGTGWRGGVSLKIKSLAEVKAVAQFGRLKTPIPYKYFFVDALACLDKGFGGALKLKGFGGGVYYHMNRPAGSNPLSSGCVGDPSIPSGLGMSLSGVVYTPDFTKGLGIKATIAIATAVKETAFNGNATLELLFNAGGGLSDLWIYGNARFMTTPVLTASPAKTTQNGAAVRASLDIHFNFNANTMDGDLEVHMNANGGVVRGGGPDDMLVWAKLHVGPELWFIKVGTPSQRCSLIIDVPVIGEVANIGTYLEIGKDLDPIPPLPSDIAALTGLTGSAGLSNRNGAMGGNGFIFGADMQIGNQEMTFLIFYAGLRARLGFDVALLDYGAGAVCANTGEQVGINGWYASGQIYAGIWGEVGIKVKVFGKRKQFKIFSVAMAAALQASLPNPFWAQGAVGGHYEILGGLIKGDCNFNVEFGEKCQVVGADDPLGEIAVVQRISPENNTSGFAIDGKPEVFFNFQIGQAFQLSDPNGNNVTYKATVNSVKIRYQGLDMPVKLEWATDKRSVKIAPEWMLPGKDTLEVVVQSHVDSSNYTIYEEERTALFITGPGLDIIPPTNVLASYPLDGQYNFFPDQIPDDHKGYIILKLGQPDLFAGDNQDKLVVRFKKNCGASTEVPLTYAGNQEKVEFPLPNNFFTGGDIYRMQVVQKGVQATANSTGGTGGNSSKPGGCGPELLTAGEKVLYSAYFRTSQYATFGAKMTAWNTSKTMTTLADKTIKAVATMEPFDQQELASLDFRAALEGVSWHNQLKTLIYGVGIIDCENGAYPKVCLGRPEDPMGLFPVKAIRMQTGGTGAAPPVITKEHWLSGSAPNSTAPVTLLYEVHKQTRGDYEFIREQIEEYVIQEMQGMILHLECEDFCDCAGALLDHKKLKMVCESANSNNGNYDAYINPPNGQYKISARYFLPGAQNPSSVFEITVQK